MNDPSTHMLNYIMSIYQITYYSGPYLVKGYLGLPHDFSIREEELKESLHKWFGKELGDECIRSIDEYPQRLTSTLNAKIHSPVAKPQYPALIYCRGGIGHVGHVRSEWLQLYAMQGFVIFAPCYRGNEGGTGYDQFGGHETEDILAAYRWIQSFSFVQQDSIGIIGFSRGSINATQAATLLSTVHFLILWGGVTDLTKIYIERVDLRKMLRRVIGGTPLKKITEFHKRSPYYLAQHIQCPTLLIHGTQDIQVNFSHALEMTNRLRRIGIPVTTHFYKGLGHHFPLYIHEAAILRIKNWIQNGYKEK